MIHNQQSANFKLKKSTLIVSFIAFLIIAFQVSNIIAQDAGVYKITSPSSSCTNLTSTEKISVLVVNYGSTTVDSIPISYQVGTGTIVNEKITTALKSHDTVAYTFTSRADLSSTGIYTLKVFTALNGAVNTSNNAMTQTVYSLGAPKVDFSVSNGCQSSAIHFTNKSTANSASISSYNWVFGDGGTSTDANPTHTYATSGTFNVKLIATTITGCRDSVTKSIKIFPKPSAVFTTANVCKGMTANFSNTSSISSGSIVSYSWNFGDSTNSTSISPVHLFTKTGAFTVSLTVVTDSGCSATTTRTITVFENPVSAFSASSGCQGSVINFNNSSSIGSGNLTYTWDFGDATASSSVNNPTHSFSSSGNFTVKLVAMSTNGCRDSVSHSITVYPLPNASFSAAPACIGSTTTFTNNSSISSGSITIYNWKFGDGVTSTDKNPVHKFANTGTYSVTLTATSDNGCSNSFTDSVMVVPIPVASFTVTNNCQGQAATFHSTSTGSLLTYNWNFGDSSTASNGANPTHIFTKPGKHVVMLTAISAGGCSSVQSDTVTIKISPVVSFKAADVCLGDTMRFNDSSFISDHSTLVFNWNFGDSFSTSGKNPAHFFIRPGVYTVTETVTSPNGCSASLSKTVAVNAPPTAGFTAKQGAALTVQFQPKDTIGGLGYVWNFGDSSATSIDINPTHVYSKAGKYIVTLKVTNISKCFSTSTDTVTVTNTGINTVLNTYRYFDVYPNPFSGTTHISYSLNENAMVNLAVYNELGALVQTIADQHQTTGKYLYDFNIINTAAPGIYFVKLTVNGDTTTRKLFELK
jgi:PKD repeat protein